MSQAAAESVPRRSAEPASAQPTLVIQPRPGWRLIDLREVWAYRDLFYFLIWRDIKSRYAQTVLGFGWAVVQPFFYMVVFTFVFGNLVNVSSDGLPYPLFSFAGLVPWTYFTAAVTDGTGSLINSSGMLSKVYFPRLVIPLTPVLAKLVDLAIAMVILFALMAWYHVGPTVWVVLLPVLLLIAALTAAGIGMLLSAMAIQYRDIKYATGFGVQLLLYAAPVVYPASLIADRYRLLYGLNPMAGVIEGFRASLLGSPAMPWDLIGVAAAVSVMLFLIGGLYFRRTERIFADVV